MDEAKLEAMKYRELQKVAKDLGLKANGNKKDLVKAILEAEAKVAGGEAIEDVEVSGEEGIDDVEVPLIPVEESKLDTTFDMDESNQNVLNETFEKESAEKDPANETFDKEESEVTSRFVEFSAKKGSSGRRRSGRSSLPEASPSQTASIVKPKAVRGGSRGGGTPKLDYLSKKNNTPLRGVTKTPASTMKKNTPLRGVVKTPGSIMKKTGSVKSAKKPVPSKLPRFVEFARRQKPKLNKVPDFAKLHEKNFKKMESLTDTVTKQLDRAKVLTNDHNELVKKMKDRKTPGKTPAAKQIKLNTPKINKTPKLDSDSRFNPTLTTAKMNLNFGAPAQKTSDLPFQFTASSKAGAPVARVVPKQRKDPKATRTVAKTPVAPRKRPSIGKTARDTPDGKPALANITNRTFDVTNKSVNGTPGKKFDIKASLARPLGYKPHKGRLAPLAGSKEEGRAAKTPQVLAKQRQMAVIKGVRLNKRTELMMKNRQMD